METTVGQEPQVDTQKLVAGMQSGANWFYWIAGLSLINSVLHLCNSERSFIVGLGITQAFDVMAMVFAKGATGNGVIVVKALAFGASLVVAGVFVLFGVFANRRHPWAFAVGMLLYLLDGGIFLLAQEWLSLGFHAFALFGIYVGFSALRKLRAIEAARLDRPITP